MAATFTLDDVTFSYPGFDLGPVSLGLEPGRIYGLLGANGAGKTTLLDLVAHQLKPAGGTIARQGVGEQWGSPAWKRRVAYVRETPVFYPELSLAELARFAAGCHEQWNAALAGRLADRLHVDGSKPVARLSKGNRTKVGLILALAAQPDLLLLDEPTSGLDPITRGELQQLLVELRSDSEETRTVVLSSHIFEDIETTADHVVILGHGRVQLQISRPDLEGAVLLKRATGSPARPSADVTSGAIVTWSEPRFDWVLAPADGSLSRRLLTDSDWEIESRRSHVEAAFRAIQGGRS